MHRHGYERAANQQAKAWRREAERDALVRTAGEPAADALLRSVREARRDALARTGDNVPAGRRALRRFRELVASALPRPGRPATDAQPGSSRSLEPADPGF